MSESRLRPGSPVASATVSADPSDRPGDRLSSSPGRRGRPWRGGRALAAFAAALSLVLVAGACGSDTATPATTTAFSGPPATVVSIASLTGSASPYGTGQDAGTRLAVDTLSGGRLVVESLDDLSTPDGGKAAMAAGLAVSPVAVLGPTLSGVAAVADPAASAAGVPVLAVTNTTLDIAAAGDTVWRVTLSESTMIPQAVAAAVARGPLRTAALVWEPADNYSPGAAEAFRAAAAAEGITIVAEVPYVEGSTTAAQVLSTAAATSPDALFLAARSALATQLLLASQDLGLERVRVGGNGFNAPEVLATAGTAADGTIVAASWNIGDQSPGMAEFIAAYRARYGIDPDAFAAQGYAGIQVLLAAMEAGGGSTPAAVQAGLGRLGSVDTVLGVLSFQGREASYPAAVQIVAGGRFTLL